ncbi:hypothetical protein ACFSBZ_16195 [Amnibacterium flavum]|uniref:Uncharacterized protein n=1 Tax=Amnibacterium flavum TaxID=2173173 RepID=A0A2V1HQA2_9MICO|nr:hypothetical protein [Amnibacterium flavum]PVZ93299.1 hypothetical protein DDQ50_16535 [Amnibacterium flavum]
MLYLLMPTGEARWLDLPRSISASFALENDLDLETFDWKPAELKVDATLVRLAVRFGLPVRSGLVVDGGTVGEYVRVGQMIKTHHDADSAHTRLEEVNGPMMEALLPGWTEQTRELNARVDTSVEAAISEAVKEVDAQLAQAPKSELASHWRSLGGYLPDPL